MWNSLKLLGQPALPSSKNCLKKCYNGIRGEITMLSKNADWNNWRAWCGFSKSAVFGFIQTKITALSDNMNVWMPFWITSLIWPCETWTVQYSDHSLNPRMVTNHVKSAIMAELSRSSVLQIQEAIMPPDPGLNPARDYDIDCSR